MTPTDARREAELILGDPPKDRMYFLGSPWLESRRDNISTALLSTAEKARKEEQEKVAKWMISLSLATGHGDTIEDLLKEATWQVTEISKKEREWCLKVVATILLSQRPKVEVGLYEVIEEAIRKGREAQA